MKTLNIDQEAMDALARLNQEEDDYVLLLHNGKPIGLFTQFNNELLQQGLGQWLLVKAYQKGEISIGQFARQMKLSLEASYQLLAALHIPVVDYDLDDDLDTIEKLKHEDHRK